MQRQMNWADTATSKVGSTWAHRNGATAFPDGFDPRCATSALKAREIERARWRGGLSALFLSNLLYGVSVDSIPESSIFAAAQDRDEPQTAFHRFRRSV